jgi:hypothetical protein
VDEHASRMAELRRYARERRDTRKFIGAAATSFAAKDIQEYAIEKGFYVIRILGDAIKIDPPKGFMPKAW